MKKAVQIDERDNVATVTSDVEEGEAVEVLSPEGSVIMKPDASDPIPFGHKLALVDLHKGDEVVKYGEIIGMASRWISPGEWVHTHNVESTTVPTSTYNGESS